MSKNTVSKGKRLLFGALVGKNASHKIAYIAVVTALVVVCNLFFEFKLAETQFSFTIAVSALAGMLIGPAFGFAACFLGDLVGFLYNSGGFAYYPWIGLAMGLIAAIFGLLIGGWESERKGFLYVKLAVASLLTFAICTVGINTTAFWILYSKVGYGTYLVSRLFAQGQIWNSLVNYALLFAIVSTLNRIKPLKIYLK